MAVPELAILDAVGAEKKTLKCTSRLRTKEMSWHQTRLGVTISKREKQTLSNQLAIEANPVLREFSRKPVKALTRTPFASFVRKIRGKE